MVALNFSFEDLPTPRLAETDQLIGFCLIELGIKHVFEVFNPRGIKFWIGSKANDPWVSKQTFFWPKTDDIWVKTDDPGQSRRSYMKLLCLKADHPFHQSRQSYRIFHRVKVELLIGEIRRSSPKSLVCVVRHFWGMKWADDSNWWLDWIPDPNKNLKLTSIPTRDWP